MITLTIRKNHKNQITEFEVNGHANFGVEGEDIVCAAVSSITQTAALGLMNIAGIKLVMTREEGYSKYTLPDSLSDEQEKAAEIILSTMYLGLDDLHQQFSDFIEITIE